MLLSRLSEQEVTMSGIPFPLLKYVRRGYIVGRDADIRSRRVPMYPTHIQVNSRRC
jgi:hypothetical protein